MLILCNFEESSNRRGSEGSLRPHPGVRCHQRWPQESRVWWKAAEECRWWLVLCRADCAVVPGGSCYFCVTMCFLESFRCREHASNPSVQWCCCCGGVVAGRKAECLSLQMMPRAFPRLQYRVRSEWVWSSCGFHAKQHESSETPAKRAIAKIAEYKPILQPTCGKS